MQTADVSAEHDAEATRAAELARIQSEKAKAAKARKAKIARERAKADQLARESAQGQWQQGQWQQGQSQFFSSAGQRTASNQQDQFYYGQRQSSAQPPAGNAYAQRPTFGPFGGWGRGW